MVFEFKSEIEILSESADVFVRWPGDGIAEIDLEAGTRLQCPAPGPDALMAIEVPLRGRRITRRGCHGYICIARDRKLI